MDCFPCSVSKRRVELELVNSGAPSEDIAARVAAVRCAMCMEAERQASKGVGPRLASS
jgi:cytochrome c2